MHDVLNSVKQKPIPKFHKNSKIFEKSQKLGQKHEMHEKVKERRSYQKKKDQSRLKKPLGMKFGV